MKAAHPEAVATTRTNPGETLRAAREDRNWSLADVATQLNLTHQRLGQLEAGDFDKLPGHTFARGYIRAYAKLLGMDQNRLVVEFDQFTGTDAAGSSVHSLGYIEEPVRLSQGLLKVVSFVLLVLVGGAGLYWWQDQSLRKGGDGTDTSLEHVEVDGADGTTQLHPLDEPEDQAVVDAQDSGVEETSPVSPEVAATPEPVVPEVAATTSPAGALANPVAPAPASPAAGMPAAPTAPVATPEASVTAAAGEGVVRLVFSADCWTQLTDATGKVLLSALKRSGESLELKGKAPFELRLGFARGAQVSYNGQAVNVAPFISGETARLKLGQ